MDEITQSPDRNPSSLQPHEVLEDLSVSLETGLTAKEADNRREEFGYNVLEEGRGEGILSMLWRQINSPLIYVLIGAGLLAFAVGENVDAVVVLAVVVLNTLIGFVQEYRAGKAIEALTQMVPEQAAVLRDEEWVTLPAAELVPGDVVSVRSGDKVPADLRLVEARNLQADEAALTGESVPVAKGVEPVEEETPVADRTSMIFNGTLVTSGTATAVTTATGMNTELGRISEMLEETSEVQTPLTRQIATFGKWLSVVILVVAVVMFAVGIFRGYPAADATLAAITLAVAAIPEGLPAIITIALAVGVRRMARRRAVIRHLPAVDTLGSTTVICSDKTGTLTRGEMTVRGIWCGSGEYEVSGVGYLPEGEITRDGEAPGELAEDLRELLRAGLLCNDSRLEQEEGEWRIDGDPTEGSLLVAAEKAGLDAREAQGQRPRKDAIPFESEKQYMATLHEQPDNGQVIYLKGSPEAVVERCEAGPDGEPLDEKQVFEQAERMADRGMRVLALAHRHPEKPLDELADDAVDRGFVLLGLAAMIDPPREEAISAVGECQSAGITVKMVTGDHSITAAAIGRQLGILNENGSSLSGSDIAGFSDEELREAAVESNVFARVAPEHKLRLVQSLQDRDEVTAMTGDGVNDAPALKQANIGVAMGIAGTDVSKESADMVLTDDNFASISAAVEEGRRVYDNLKKALAFILPTNVGQGLLILLAVMFFPIVGGEPLLPVQPTQALWINLVVAVALALPLAFEAKEPDLMHRLPREPNSPILDRPLFLRTIGVGAFVAAAGIGMFLLEYYGAVARGVSPDVALSEAQTLAVTTVILVHVFYLLNCRSLYGSFWEMGLWTNKWIYVGIAVILLLQAGFVYLPFMNVLFHTAPLGLGAWLQAAAVAVVIVPLIGLEKRWWRNRSERVRSR